MVHGAVALVVSAIWCSVEGVRVRKKSTKLRHFSSCGVRGEAEAPTQRNGTSISIVNGQEATECKWRWQVGLQRSSNPTSRPFCGGSLITPEWVLTAAHCVHHWTFFMDAVTGSLNPRKANGDMQRRKVVQVIRHPGYVSATKGWDFALLRLESPMELNECVGTVCLPVEGEDAPPETSCWITGWGSRGKGVSRSDVLQEVSVETIGRTECVGDNYDYNASQITPQMLCAQGRTADGKITDACTGDSGGPLVCETSGTWTLYGATSWGKGCAGERHPGVWARVHSALDWIDETIASNTAKPTPAPGKCPFFAYGPNPDTTGHCRCGGRGELCSIDRTVPNCPTSEGPGGRGGSRFLQTCEECRCYPNAQ